MKNIVNATKSFIVSIAMLFALATPPAALATTATSTVIVAVAIAAPVALATGCSQRSDGGDDNPGVDAGPAADGGSGDEVPPPESAAWPCRGGKDSGGDYFECAESFIDADSALTDYWVGACPSEGVNGYWSGPKKAATPVNGWFRLYLHGTASDCELTVSQCSDRTNPHCWMQYGTGSIASDDLAGPYRWCSSAGCAMKLKRNANHTPTPLGN